MDKFFEDEEKNDFDNTYLEEAIQGAITKYNIKIGELYMLKPLGEYYRVAFISLDITNNSIKPMVNYRQERYPNILYTCSCTYWVSNTNIVKNSVVKSK